MSTSASRRGTASDADQAPFAAARRELEREREILATEVDALEAFHRRVRDVETTASADSTRGVRTVRSGPAGRAVDPGGNASAVRTAYEETVMSVPHYESEYGDGCVESLASEFSVELAESLRDGAWFPAFLKRRVLDAASEATDRRRRLLALLDRESPALETARVELGAIRGDLFAIDSRPVFDCAGAELRRRREDLASLRERCDDLAARRQGGDLFVSLTGASGDPLAAYLYGSVASTHPVLGAIATVGDRIESVDRELALVLEALHRED